LTICNFLSIFISDYDDTDSNSSDEILVRYSRDQCCLRRLRIYRGIPLQ